MDKQTQNNYFATKYGVGNREINIMEVSTLEQLLKYHGFNTGEPNDFREKVRRYSLKQYNRFVALALNHKAIELEDMANSFGINKLI